MKNAHIVIPDLFLPQQLADYACGDLRVPALEKLLVRAHVSPLNIASPEAWLCKYFGVDGVGIAPLTLRADGLLPGDAYWLRADPVGISMQRDQMVLRGDIDLSEAEAAQLCSSLNSQFAGDGLRFVAPHPQRWYLQLEQTPDMETHPLPQVVGADMHAHLPYGGDALSWHKVLNEIQMLFYEHAVNQAREMGGKPAVNGVWLWGGGKYKSGLLKPFSRTVGDSELAYAFAQAAGIPVEAGMSSDSLAEQGDLLLVNESLRIALQKADIGQWRSALLLFENTQVQPLLAALAAGQIEKITLDVPGENSSRRYVLTRGSWWKFWRVSKPLLHYALTSP